MREPDLDKRDLALQRSCPTVSVPRFSDFERAAAAGERVLVAANGVFLEVTRPWGYFVRQIAAYTAPTPLPYGQMSTVTQLAMQKLPRHLLEELNEMARQNSDVEIGASIAWNEHTGQLRLLQSEAIAASSSHLKYRLPDLEVGDHVVIDCHSHSRLPAFFSGEDNADDAHAVKFAYVVGHCHRPVQSAKLRLCVKGIFENIPMQLFSTTPSSRNAHDHQFNSYENHP